MSVVKTFKDLQDAVLRWVDEYDDADVTRENVKQALNAAQQRRLGSHKWPFMRWPEPVRFSTVVGQRGYALHQEFHRGVYFYNVTAKRFLRELTDKTLGHALQSVNSLDRFIDAGTSGVDAVGSADRFELRGTLPVQAQPSSASVLTISSSSTGDTGKQAVVRGETTSGIEEETLTTGASGAAAAGTVEFTKILSVQKVGTWNGTMTLTANSGAVTVLKLFASEYGRFYRQLWLINEPDAVEEIEYDFFRQILPMEDDNDLPMIPPPHSEILVYDALLDLLNYAPGEGGAAQRWERRAQELEQGLTDTYGSPDALDADADYISYIPRE